MDKGRRDMVFLLILLLALSAANMLFSLREDDAIRRAPCTAIEQLATIPLPAPTAPSRQFAVALEAAYRHRAAALGCAGRRP